MDIGDVFSLGVLENHVALDLLELLSLSPRCVPRNRMVVGGAGWGWAVPFKSVGIFSPESQQHVRMSADPSSPSLVSVQLLCFLFSLMGVRGNSLWALLSPSYQWGSVPPCLLMNHLFCLPEYSVCDFCPFF